MIKLMIKYKNGEIKTYESSDTTLLERKAIRRLRKDKNISRFLILENKVEEVR